MHKRGWIQIVEASVSILILFGLVLGLFQQRIEAPNIGAQVYKIQHQILTEASEDYCIRNEIISNNTLSLNNFITSRLCTLPYGFTTVLCDPTETCLFPGEQEGDIYADNLIIAANLTNYNPVKIAFFVWQGSTPCSEEPYFCNITSPSGEEPGCTFIAWSTWSWGPCSGGVETGTRTDNCGHTETNTRTQIPSGDQGCTPYAPAVKNYCECGPETGIDKCRDNINNDGDSYAADTDPECFA